MRRRHTKINAYIRFYDMKTLLEKAAQKKDFECLQYVCNALLLNRRSNNTDFVYTVMEILEEGGIIELLTQHARDMGYTEIDENELYYVSKEEYSKNSQYEKNLLLLVDYDDIKDEVIEEVNRKLEEEDYE